MNEIIALVANVSLALSFVVALVFGIVQVQAATRERRERLALEALRTYESREFAELMQFILTVDMPKTQEALRALPERDRIMFTHLAQHMESLGLMVSAGAVSLDLVERTHGSFVTMAWEKYKVPFADMRKNSSDPYLGEYFQWLAERIEEQMRDTPREPFYKKKSI